MSAIRKVLNEYKAFDAKMFEQIGGTSALSELADLRALADEGEEAEKLRRENIALMERVAALERDLRSAPNPYGNQFALSKYKGWYVTDRLHNLPAVEANNG